MYVWWYIYTYIYVYMFYASTAFHVFLMFICIHMYVCTLHIDQVSLYMSDLYYIYIYTSIHVWMFYEDQVRVYMYILCSYLYLYLGYIATK